MRRVFILSVILAIALCIWALVTKPVGAQELLIDVTITTIPQQGRVLTQIQLDSSVPFDTDSVVVTAVGSDSIIVLKGFTNEDKTLLVHISSTKSCFHVVISGSTVTGIGFVYDRWFTDGCFKNQLTLITKY